MRCVGGGQLETPVYLYVICSRVVTWERLRTVRFMQTVDLTSGFFLTPAAEKTKTQGKNSSQKLKEKTQPPGGFSLQLGKFKKKT